MIRRRALIVSGGLAALASTAGWPGLVSRAFAQDRPPTDASLAALSEAYRAAQRAGRPLLVLVIPEDNAARWERGAALGAFLNHGPETALTAIGLTELTCAPMSVLRQLVPQAPAGEPLMVLVDPRTVPATAQALDALLPPEPAQPRDMWETEGASERYYATLDARIDAQIAIVAGLVDGALGARVTALAPAERAAALQRVGTYRAHRIRGSYWGNQGGCGVFIEEVPTSGAPPCGMGHTPERAQRFLYFFSPGGL